MRCFPMLVRMTLLAALALPAASAHAASSLTFESRWCTIELEVGDADRPVVAGVRFHQGDDAKGVRLPQDAWTAVLFDVEQRQLELRYRGDEKTDVPPFELHVDRARAMVVIDGETILGMPFEWEM